MPRYHGTVAFSVQCYAEIEFEAPDDEAAKDHARKLALEPEGWSVAYETADEHRVVLLNKGDGDEDDEVIAEDLYPESDDGDLQPEDMPLYDDEEEELRHQILYVATRDDPKGAA